MRRFLLFLCIFCLLASSSCALRQNETDHFSTDKTSQTEGSNGADTSGTEDSFENVTYCLGVPIEADTSVKEWQEDLASHRQPLQIVYDYNFSNKKSTLREVYTYDDFPVMIADASQRDTTFAGYSLYIDVRFIDDMNPNYINVREASVFKAFREMILGIDFTEDKLPDDNDELYFSFLLKNDEEDLIYTIYRSGLVSFAGMVSSSPLSETQAAYFFAVFSAYRSISVRFRQYCIGDMTTNGMAVMVERGNDKIFLEGQQANAFLAALSDEGSDGSGGYFFHCHALINSAPEGEELLKFTVGMANELKDPTSLLEGTQSTLKEYSLYTDGRVAIRREPSVLYNPYASSRTLDVVYIKGYFLSDNLYETGEILALLD